MKEIKLRQERYSPYENPFLNKSEIYTDNQIIKTHITQQRLVNPDTGEIIDIPTIHVIEKENEKNFVKIFAAGIQAIFDLSRTGYRALVLALQTYHENQNNHDGSITLIWYDGGVNGKKLDMTDRTFYSGLKELTNKGILKPKLPNQYWVNPILFFKGEKIAFMKEYQMKSSSTKLDILPDEYQTDIEDITGK
ncbi:replication/maintenance protein RepL [Candidatus Bartonella washoeensis]|uniref:Plasmid replication protein RepL domain-containing protein n=1 Tax=Cardidatus Bartonella washoeensis 085-0475 TaxID=1094564 RepID=J1JDH3_9HYPH|nr:replication/maintenance protein RepL [Bartonella washoeensis]EJF82492.1 hypothetical protein MCW_01659 [Bartonella washoeensis 085-0475]